tara:strand:+ start:2251 stop:2589 length:339 start_codon:yes stop_codon:yes gene_type:complete
MKSFIVTYILLTFILTSCDKNENEIKEIPFNATVIEKGLDCGNSYLIKFNDNVSGIPQNSFDNIFYEINLSEEYKIDGIQIYVEFRLPENDEFMICTALGIAYPQIYIIGAE